MKVGPGGTYPATACYLLPQAPHSSHTAWEVPSHLPSLFPSGGGGCHSCSSPPPVSLPASPLGRRREIRLSDDTSRAAWKKECSLWVIFVAITGRVLGGSSATVHLPFIIVVVSHWNTCFDHSWCLITFEHWDTASYQWKPLSTIQEGGHSLLFSTSTGRKAILPPCLPIWGGGKGESATHDPAFCRSSGGRNGRSPGQADGWCSGGRPGRTPQDHVILPASPSLFWTCCCRA